MPKWIFLIVLVFVQIQVFAQKVKETGFILSGTITDSKMPQLYLIYEDSNGIRKNDSCKIVNGKFEFRGKLSEPKMALIKANAKEIADNENPNITSFFIEPGSMHLTLQYDHFKDRKLNGSKTEKESALLEKLYDTINKNAGSLSEKYAKVSREYIESHPNSFVGLHLLSTYKGRWSLESVRSLFKNFNSAIQNTETGKKIKEFIANIEDNNEGQPAKNFNVVDINTKAISLSDFKGKYVILDFWGSWCIPCRESFPHLKELFAEYRNKGLEVIGIAQELEKTDIAWRAAVKKDGTDIWFNIWDNSPLNLKNNSQTIVDKYAIHSFPTKILIDPKGTIIGRYIGTSNEGKLDKKLAEIFK